MEENVKKLLDRAWVAYDAGTPIMSDEIFDELSSRYHYDDFGSDAIVKAKHKYPMHSLQKVYDDEPSPLQQGKETIESPKLDGSAVSLLYVEGVLVLGLRRGKGGIEGEDITDKMYQLVPNEIGVSGVHQVEGEVVCPKDIKNARNFASGALGTKDLAEFIDNKSDKLTFIAYGVKPAITEQYSMDMAVLMANNFVTVLQPELKDHFRTDGTVYRLDDNELFDSLGFTAKHPRGAYARKLSSDVAIVETTLLDCIWQVGRTGKVTPVAIFENVVIDDANITNATLHNAGFIEEMDLDIGDTILVTRSGGIIPKVLGKV